VPSVAPIEPAGPLLANTCRNDVVTIQRTSAALSRRDILAAAIVATSGAAIAGTPVAGTPTSALTGTQWREDIRFLFEELRRRHRDLFHHTPEPRYRAGIENLCARCGEMESWRVIAGIQHVVALAGDGHTFLFAKGLYRSYPFETAWFGDEIRVVRTAPEYGWLLGSRIERLDGLGPRAIARRLDRVIPQAETPWYVLGQRPDRLRRAELLAALGVAKSPDRITLEATSATSVHSEHVIEAMSGGKADDGLAHALGPRLPDLPDRGFAWRRLENGSVVHLNFRGYENLPQLAARFFADLHGAPPRVLVIDLRENSGGNYTLPREHIIAPLQEMPALNRAGRLFVLIGRKTFSAAMTNATDFRRETEALLVGEPAGARPNGYQELQTFTLPNSGLKVGCSTAAYRFGAPGDLAVVPDLPVAPDWTSFARGRDIALDAAIAHWRSTAA